MCDISDKEFNERYLPFLNNFKEYMNNYVIPDVVAFYIADSYSRNSLCDSSLYNHINSAIDIFNCSCDIYNLIPTIKDILKIKYNLKIVKTNPLRLKKNFIYS